MQQTITSFARLSIICESETMLKRESEDVYAVWSDGGKITLLVADGVTQRVETTKLQQLFAANGNHATASSYAANLTRSTIANKIAQDQPMSLRDLLLDANKALRNQLEIVYGELTADALLRAEPQLEMEIQNIIKKDSRFFRLAIPACVATIVRVDLVACRLEFAHAGDTALFLFYQDGRVDRITDDQMRKHDTKALELARKVQDKKEFSHFSEALSDQLAVRKKFSNGIYHNYVDQYGQIDTKVGVGVINGLPELAAYIQQGTVNLKEVSSLLLCSDGLIWPTGWNESDTHALIRLQDMHERIKRLNLSGYLAELRNEEQKDATLDRYPRFKIHDNATGIYLELF
jgi:serine/threonine protein phosphatase PrpC